MPPFRLAVPNGSGDSESPNVKFDETTVIDVRLFFASLHEHNRLVQIKGSLARRYLKDQKFDQQSAGFSPQFRFVR